MALYAVYYQTGVSPLDGEPLCTVCLITQSEELTKAGLTAWYDQIQ